MGAAIVRSVKRSGVGGRLAKHILGQIRPKSAQEREGLQAVVPMKPEGSAGTMKGMVAVAADSLMKARKTAPKKRGPAPMGAVELMFAGPPRYAAPEAWPGDKVGDWAIQTLKWRDTRFPKCVSSITALHQDEGSPHVHDLMAAIDRQGRVGWNYVLEDVYGEQDGKPTLKAGDRGLLSRMQDDYWDSVGRHFGLDRGERGRGRQHAPVNRETAARIRELEDQVAALEGELTAARAPTGPVRGGAVPVDEADRAPAAVERPIAAPLHNGG